jgi:hypothetical protein
MPVHIICPTKIYFMQKNFYLLLVFISASLISNAQIKQGTILLGGDIGIATENSSPAVQGNAFQTKETNVSLAPSIGKAIKDNLVVGIDLNYSNSGYVQGSPATTTNTSGYGAGVFLRRYKYLGSRFYIFMQSNLDASYNTLKAQNSNEPEPAQDSKGYTVSLGFYPGISYAITNCVQLETGFQNLLHAQYGHAKETDTDGTTAGENTFSTNNFSLGTSLNDELYGFVVGVRIFFNH